MYTLSMFESIKDALVNSDKGGSTNSAFKDILKFKAGNTYILRLLPNIKDNSKTFHHFYVNGWKSFSTGEYVSSVSLQTIGKRDPISTELFQLKKNGTEQEKKKAEAVKWQEQWYVNVYVVDDPVTPENNGTVKILRFGRKLHKKFVEAISGSDADEYGFRVFDLGENGVNFKLKVEENDGGYITYESSRFTSPFNLNLTTERQAEIYNSIHDLTVINPVKPEEEIIKLWNKHFLCVEGLPSLSEEDTDLPAENSPLKEETPLSKNISDDMVNELLKGLEDS